MGKSKAKRSKGKALNIKRLLTDRSGIGLTCVCFKSQRCDEEPLKFMHIQLPNNPAFQGFRIVFHRKRMALLRSPVAPRHGCLPAEIIHGTRRRLRFHTGF